MFTGLVRQRGRLIREPRASGRGGTELWIGHGEELSAELALGASLAVSGVCLTVVDLAPGVSAVELSPETLSRTTLGSLVEGSPVNLEPALRMGDVLGGHWVQGHVDGTLAVLARRDLEEHREITFELPQEVRGLVVEKGSVTLDGVSLTVAGLDEAAFSVALIPHTLEVTTLVFLEPGDRVNFEVDILAKYVQRAVEAALGGRG
ncbi:MAG: riboflavin synthase [Thermoanaerobaculia bacterium]